jgi:hypothetical protein
MAFPFLSRFVQNYCNSQVLRSSACQVQVKLQFEQAGLPVHFFVAPSRIKSRDRLGKFTSSEELMDLSNFANLH